jgi:hypothetical protein
MAKTPKPRRRSPAAWFDSFPPIDPPGWDDADGWCRRHWAPLAGIPDPAQRGCAQRLAALELTGVFASVLRRRVKPLPVPARKLGRLALAVAPVCCWLGDSDTQAIVLAAIETAEHPPARKTTP